jgi:hypothetical protein
LSGLVYCYIAPGRQAKFNGPFYPYSWNFEDYPKGLGEIRRLGIYSTAWQGVLGPMPIEHGKAGAGKVRRFVVSDARFRTTQKMAGKCWYF